MPEVDCIFADDFYRPDSVTCSAGHYGGRPSLGVCTEICTHRRPDPNLDQRAPKPFKPVMARMAPKLAARAIRNMAVCESCNHKVSFNQRHVHCAKCMCDRLPTWEDSKCPLGLWEQVQGKALHVEPLKYARPEDKTAHWQAWEAQNYQKPPNFRSGRTAFLICGGPSLKTLDLDLLHPFVTMGMNGSPQAHLPDYWVAMDAPTKFQPELYESVYLNPDVAKFVPYDNRRYTEVRRPEAPNRHTGIYYPSTYMVRHNSRFHWWRFFADPLIHWGRNTMVVALRLLYDLGIRRVFLLGVDFHMEPDREYAFKQRAGATHADMNNGHYIALQRKFELLQPVFLSLGYHVYNCNPDSKLTAFPFWGYHKAIKLANTEAQSCLHGTTSPALIDR